MNGKLDSNNAPIGYIAKDNDPLYPNRHPCFECDFRHIRLIDFGFSCKKPFSDRTISCCAFGRPDKHTVHFKKKETI